MNIKEFRQHVREMVSKRVYESMGETNYTDIINDFMDSVNRQKGIKNESVKPLTELEGTAYVFGDNYDFEFGYDVYSRPYVKSRGGDDYNEPIYDKLGGNFEFAITSANVVDKDGNVVCDFDDIVDNVNGGYDRIKDWFVFDEREMIEPLDEEINELTRRQKQRNIKNAENFFKKGKSGYNGIRTIVVLTSENPDSQESTSQFNKKARHSLLSDIKNGGYAYVPAMGKFGNVERPYAVFNMSVDTAKILCGKYQQTSFVFSSLNEDGSVHSEYYEKQDPTLPYNKKTNDYVKKDECDTWEDMSEANDYFTVIGKKFKYSIPFKIFDNVNETICKNLYKIVCAEKKRGNNTLTEEKALMFTINGVGQSPYLWRKAITKGI